MSSTESDTLSQSFSSRVFHPGARRARRSSYVQVFGPSRWEAKRSARARIETKEFDDDLRREVEGATVFGEDNFALDTIVQQKYYKNFTVQLCKNHFLLLRPEKSLGRWRRAITVDLFAAQVQVYANRRRFEITVSEHARSNIAGPWKELRFRTRKRIFGSFFLRPKPWPMDKKLKILFYSTQELQSFTAALKGRKVKEIVTVKENRVR